MEAEFVALDKAAEEAGWLRSFLEACVLVLCVNNYSLLRMVVMMQPWNKSGRGPSGTMMTMSAEAKYMIEDASNKKFLVSNFTNYKMTDSRQQYNELLGTILGIPKKEELTLVGLARHLRIEDSLDDRMVMLRGRLTQEQLMQDMSKDGLIPAFDMDTEKCKTCMLTKITKKPFQNVKRETKALELVYCYLCVLFAIPSLENKKYFLKFIDDASRAVVRLPDPKLKILGEKGIECVFVGYAEHSKAFRAVVRLLDPKLKTLGERCIECINASLLNMMSIPRLLGYTFNVEDDLKTFDKAMKSQDPQIAVPKKDGTIEKFKARLVIQDFRQKSGIDYFDTYAPLTHISTIRLLIAMASIHNLIIHQMDVKTAFLNGELDEEVYVNQPQGFIMPGNENKVCKLIKSLYRLNQAPEQWHQKFNEMVLSSGYLLYQADKCVYSKFDESVKGVIICLYVDDIQIFDTDQVQVDLTKEFFLSKFFIKDMGKDDVILGIKIKHESNGITISQSYYIKKVMKKFNYFDCTPVSTPMDTSEKLMHNNGQAVSQLEYSTVISCLMYVMTCIRPDIAFAVGKLRSLTYTGYPSVLEGYTDASWISNAQDNSSTNTSEKLMPNNGQAVSQLEYSRVIGCLMYVMTCTRPDIAFAVGKLSRYTSNPGTQHWQAIQRVLKYLKKTMDYRLTYTGYPSVLEGYTNASWISNTEDNSSTSGWVFLLGGGAISWASKKQTCITGSTMESEFVALAAAGKEAEWLKNLLLEIPLWVKPIAPISIRCDSAATLAKAYSQMYNGKSRHLGVLDS
ncbi:zinc finger, CCHC-type containing protein [Tanacetum coccineum]